MQRAPRPRSGHTPYTLEERARALRWKAATPTLPTLARAAARYVDKDGRSAGPPLGFCLPREYARWNLLPEVRDVALEVFAELAIPWHAGVDGGPSNHLLSSQVQCVNALGQMVGDPERTLRAFGEALDVTRVLPIEPGRYLTFEYNGEEDLLHEAVDGVRTRGAYTTSVDAALLHEHREGFRELLLLEWKFSGIPNTPSQHSAVSLDSRTLGALTTD